MPDDFQNPSEQPADFSNYFESQQSQSGLQPGQSENDLSNGADIEKNSLTAKTGKVIKRPVLTIAVASVLLVIVLALIISFLNSPARRGQNKIPPLVVPKSSVKK